MQFKYKLVKSNDDETIEKEYKTLKEIAEDINVEIHLIRKINQLTENRTTSFRPHNVHKELFDKVKIYNLKKDYKI